MIDWAAAGATGVGVCEDRLELAISVRRPIPLSCFNLPACFYLSIESFRVGAAILVGAREYVAQLQVQILMKLPQFYPPFSRPKTARLVSARQQVRMPLIESASPRYAAVSRTSIEPTSPSPPPPHPCDRDRLDLNSGSALVSVAKLAVALVRLFVCLFACSLV